MKNAIGYIRVSTEEQGKGGVSIDAQHEKIVRYAEFKGFDTTILEEPPISGSSPFNKRKVGSGLIRQIERGDVTDIIVTKLDRLFRDLKDCVNNIEDWEGKVVVHLVDEGGTIDTSTPDGYFNVMIKALFAAYEVRVIRHRTRTALQHKKAIGQVYNHLPFGFDAIDGELVPNSDEQYVIGLIQGMFNEGDTLAAIVKHLNKNMIPGKKGGRWHAKTVKGVLEGRADRELSR